MRKKKTITIMTKFIHLIFLLNFTLCVGQQFEFAVINDNDGFVNVRSSNEIKNNIIDKLENGFIVTHFGAEGNWIHIDYQKNGKELDGFIYKDRVKGVFKFTKIPKLKSSNNQIQFSNEKIEITISERNFDKDKHTFKYFKGNLNQLNLIDGKIIFGTDGNIPKREYSSIEVKIDTLKILLPKKAIENLYEPNLNYTSVNFDEATETLYIQTLNGDGAGGYAVMWVIEKGKFKKRITAMPF